MNRPALAVQLAIFILVIVAVGLVIMVLNEVVSGMQTWQQNTYPSGVYPQDILNFFATTWYWWPFIAVLIPMIVWLILHAQRRIDPDSGLLG